MQRNRAFAFVGLGLMFAISVLAMSVDAQGQEAATPRTFGTKDLGVQTIFRGELDPVSDAGIFTWGLNANGRVCIISSQQNTCSFQAGVSLPEGALLETLELEACDSTNQGRVVASLSRGASPNDVGTVTGVVSVETGIPNTPGCRFFPVDLPSPLTIDNRNNLYWVQVAVSDNLASLLGFHAVRLFYRRQVSPAPATATFGDVPTSHPFFQFVEALVASGITAGCGGGNYCPDAALTRGQMAVFLSKGLGLHFAP